MTMAASRRYVAGDDQAQASDAISRRSVAYVSAKRSAKIVVVMEGTYAATTENARIPQREKLEETMVNLATFLGAKLIKRATIQDGSYIYSVDDYSYQSASNTILHLSRRIARQRSADITY
ncbi:hypothetical protein ACVIGB_003794 [Bradyrhizobium sp. USDA 4341]